MAERLVVLLSIYHSWVICGIYIAIELGITIWADLMDQKKSDALAKRIPMLVVTTLESVLLQFVLAFAKLFEIMTFRLRRLVW